MHLPAMIQDLAIVLIVGAVMTLLFRAIRQPVVLGYIVAGFLVGPHFEFMPSIVETESIKVWAEIGVIFLLFALGLEFSFKKLARVGAPALIIALVEVGGMSALGFLAGKAFGWRDYDSLFLGGILAISSTTIIIRTFEDLEIKTRGFVKLVFGVLIIEDLVAILLMVILSTIAVSQKFTGFEMSVAGLKLAFFLTLWFVLGIFLIPSLLNKLRTLMKGETLLIVALGLCFLMVVFATKVGFSPALGAFVMGSILAETEDSERIEQIVGPVKDLFGAVFFVSVGMLIDPSVLLEYWFPIIVITGVTIFGKLITCTIGSLFAGQSLRHSVQTGLSLAQIGEFSFIIAGLGLSLNVTSDFLYPIAISVAVITCFTTPYLIRSSDSVVRHLERWLPRRWINSIERFRANSVNTSRASEWKRLLKMAAAKIATNAVVVTAIFMVCSEFLQHWLIEQLWDQQVAQAVTLFVALLVSAPFFWGIAGRRIAGDSANQAWSEKWNESGFPGPLFALDLLRWLFAIMLCATLATLIVPPVIAFLIVSILLAANFLVLSRYFEQIYMRFENRFVKNLNEKEAGAIKRAPPTLAPWDSHLAELKIFPDSPFIGRTFAELSLRERFGVTVALIQRGHSKIIAPGPDAVFYPGDVLQVIGSDEQINVFRRDCETIASEIDATPLADYVLQPVYVRSEASYANKTIRLSGVRELANGLVVGIEKHGKRTLNPDSSILIEPGDVLWIVGDQNRISTL